MLYAALKSSFVCILADSEAIADELNPCSAPVSTPRLSF
jgi:hypothetical protein